MCLNGSSTQDLSGKEEAWNYYMEIFDVIEKRAQVIPHLPPMLSMLGKNFSR